MPRIVLTPSPKSPFSRPTAFTNAFSLLELLVVISIIAILAALITPAVNGFGRSLALSNGGTMVNNLISVARQNAMTKNTLTALVMLADQGTSEDYRAFTVLEYHAGSGSNLGSWWQLTNWDILPEGIVVDRNDTSVSSFLLNSASPLPFNNGSNVLPVLYQKAAVSGPKGCVFRVFTPSGRLQNSEAAAQIRVVEGFNRGSATVRTHPGNGAPANYFDIAIIGATGNTKIGHP